MRLIGYPLLFLDRKTLKGLVKMMENMKKILGELKCLKVTSHNHAKKDVSSCRKDVYGPICIVMQKFHMTMQKSLMPCSNIPLFWSSSHSHEKILHDHAKIYFVL